MTFRSREAARIFNLRAELFSPEGCRSLLQNRHRFRGGCEEENIYGGFRQDVLEFFKSRRIKWHGHGSCDISIVSSQVACQNCFFQFVDDPVALRSWLSTLYPDLAEVLPINSRVEPPLRHGGSPFVIFEWIGERNYLDEPRWGGRGQNCTSADAIFRFRHADDKIHIVLAEWKYCENDQRADYQHISDNGTDRVAIYRPHLDASGCQISLGDVRFENFFFNPLYQFARQQLLASAMEREREMDANVVSVLHIAPRANDGLLNLTLSKSVAPGTTVGEVWSSIAKPGDLSPLRPRI